MLIFIIALVRGPVISARRVGLYESVFDVCHYKRGLVIGPVKQKKFVVKL